MSTVADLCALALEAHRSGDLSRAEQLYQQVLQVEPHQADAHHLLGVLEFQSGRKESAVARIRQAIALNPTATPYLVNLGLIYNSLGAFDDAIECFNRAWRLNGTDIGMFDHLASALLSQQLAQPAKAREHYLRVLALNPGHVEATRIRAWLVANP